MAYQPSAKLAATTLLVKRPAFNHEREVRLILVLDDKSKSAEDTFSYPLDPNDLIDQIMLDPRMPQDKANYLKRELKSKARFAGTVKRSLLYAPPPSWTIPL